jgi:Tol biopolymer transport system component
VAWLGGRPTVGISQSNLTVTAVPVQTGQSGDKPPVFSDNGMHFAYVGPAGSRWTVFFDGKGGNKYDEIGTFGNLSPQQQFIFSEDASHCAFAARTGANKVIVVDGQEIPMDQEFWTVTEAMFSPDGSQFAYAVNPQHADGYVVLGGKQGPPCLSVKDLHFSSDSKHFAYVMNISDKTQNKYTVTRDGQAEGNFESIAGLTFSLDGAHCAYIGNSGYAAGAQGPGQADKKAHLIVDGKESAVFDEITGFQFSADGQHLMCIAGKAQGDKKDGNGRPLYDLFICLDAQQWPFTPKVTLQGTMPPLLSPDGKRVAYVEATAAGTQGKGAVITVNGQKGSEYENISQMQFSPDGQHVAYLAVQGMDSRDSGGNAFVVSDGNELGPYPMGQNTSSAKAVVLSFSPDAKHFVFTAADGTHAYVVADGKKGSDYDIVQPVVFSSQGGHMAYFASIDRLKNQPPLARQQAMSAPDFDPGTYVVLDGVEQRLPPKTFFSPSNMLHFSPDGNHLAYLVSSRQGGGNSGLVVDGKLVKVTDKNENIASNDPAIQFSPDSRHIIYDATSIKDGMNCFGVDGDLVGGYSIVAWHNSTPVVGFNGGKMQYFAKLGMYGPIQSVTVDLGPARNFGAVASADNATPAPANPAPNNPAPQANAMGNQPNQPKPSPPSNNTAVDTAAQKATNALGNLFHH